MKAKKGSEGDYFRFMVVNIVLGIALTVMAVMAFLNPEENMVLFPLIFYTAAAMRICDGIYGLMGAPREGKWKSVGMRDMILGIVILLLGTICAIAIWS